MTRKKSRPTHRENAAAVPSNEGGFYKMFWNSMDTSQGTNGPCSPSPVDVPVTSPALIIITDSPDGSPCAVDENSSENILVPLPIKEEIRDPVEKTRDSSGERNCDDLPECHNERINGVCVLPPPRCLPGNPLTSSSEFSSPSPLHQADLSSKENQPQPIDCANVTSVSESDEVDVREKTSTGENSEVSDSSNTFHITKDGCPARFEEKQVCNPVSSAVCDVLLENPNHQVLDSGKCMTEEMSSNNGIVKHCDTLTKLEEAHLCESTPRPPLPVERISVNSQDISVLGVASNSCSNENGESATIDNLVTNENPSCTDQEILPETPMDVVSSPVPAQQNAEQAPTEDLFDPHFSSVDANNGNAEAVSTEAIQNPQSPTSCQILNLLSCMLNADEEELENLSRQLDLSGLNNDGCNEPSDANELGEGEGINLNSDQDNSFHGNTEVSSMEIDQNTVISVNNEANVFLDVSQSAESAEMIVENEIDEFPTLSNFLPKKIKIDTIGVMRSVRILKDEARSLYKEYLKDDVLLRTASAPVPVEESPQSPDVEETPSLPTMNVYPICCVKMERLPDPFVKKSTITMSDDTFKTWKRQITRQRNEEKFRRLKVWRRGRTLLWRECELAGMDRATYDEQVAYIKKHKVHENSSSDEDCSGDESVDDSPSRHFESSGESSEDEHVAADLSSIEASSPKTDSKDSSGTLLHTELGTSNKASKLGDEYVVERNLASPSFPSKAPSALKITIRKASTSKSEEDKEKTTDSEDNFTVPSLPSFYKSRKVATKRTFRRPDHPIKSFQPKSNMADSKKSKTPVEPEDLYDQSLLGTRRDEVENFNLLEKWDIPFEAPTLFRSPRVASRLAQLKTKEAFATIHKKHAPKTAVGASTVAVSKEVKDVVELLCSKTVEAILFPEAKTAGSTKSVETSDGCGVDPKDSTASMLPIEVPCKPSVLNYEKSSTLDESTEISQSETSSTLDASSDFGGSTTSLMSDDLPPPKDKSPQKPRRRRRFGGWNKKKVKGKVPDEPVVKDSPEGDETSVKEVSKLPNIDTQSSTQNNEPPVQEKTGNENDGLKLKASASPAHSTQVPVVSEGPGQSPYESEDDSSHRTKAMNQSGPSPTVDVISREKVGGKTNRSTKQKLSDCETGTVKIPNEEPQTTKKAEQEVIPRRLTRSKQPSIELDPDLLENFGTRKRKPKSDTSSLNSSNDSKKTKAGVAKTTLQRSKVRSNVSPGSHSSTFESTVDDGSNTQVPEVSEGPGEETLDSESKQDQDNSKESQAPQVRMLRSRSRLSCPTSSNMNDKADGARKTRPLHTENEKTTENNEFDELESPQSPPPEPVEPEPLIDNRITRSKKRRSGPAYVAVKTTIGNDLPSVSDVVNSIAGKRLPTLSNLFDTTIIAPSPATEPICSFRVTSVDKSPCIDDTVTTGSLSEPSQKSRSGEKDEPPTHDGKLDQPLAHQDTGPTSESNQDVQLDPDVLGNKPRTEMVSNSSVGDPLDKSLESNISELLPERSQSTAVVASIAPESNQSTVVKGNSFNSQAVRNLKGGNVELPAVAGLGSGRLEVLDTLNSILSVTSPKKDFLSASPKDSSIPSLSADLHVLPTPNITQSSITCSSSLPTGIPQSISSILPGTLLPGTLLPSLPDLKTTLDTDFGSLSNDIEDSTIISPWADSPGDLVVDDDDAELNTNTTLDVLNDFIKDSALEGFSDDETNNTDLADKIDKIILDQMHQDTSPIPSLKTKETLGGSKGNDKPDQDAASKSESDGSASTLTRRDSIDERTGLPNTLIQRLRDPRIRSRLLSHLEEVETGPLPTGPSDQPAVVPRDSQVIVPTTIGSSQGVPASAVCTTVSQPVPSVEITVTQISASQNLMASSDSATTLSTQVSETSRLNLVRPITPLQTLIDIPGGREEPPDPSKVEFLVPPSDDEEEESIKRRPKKAKKEVDVELMYKSPLEDLQEEARPGYGERAPRRYGGNFPRRKIGDVRPKWDERRSRRDEPRSYNDSRDGRPSRDRSRDRRFGGPQGRDRSRDKRAYCDRPLSDQSRDGRSYDDHYPRGDEHEVPNTWDHIDGFNQSHWLMVDPASSHQTGMMINPPEPPQWPQNYYPEANVQPTPPMFVPDPPKIDYMETRLINLELLPKTTNLDIPPIKKVYSHFNKDNIQMLRTPPPTYDPNDQARTIKMMDPTGEEMIDFVQLPRPTSGLTKEFFRHVPPDLSLDDVVKFHFISPAYVMVRDNEEDPVSASDDEDDQLEATYGDKLRLAHMKRVKSLHETNLNQERRLGIHRKPEGRLIQGSFDQEGMKPVLNDIDVEVRMMEEGKPAKKIKLANDPLENLLQNFPLLKEQYSMQKSQVPAPPPPPEWNDVDLRVSGLPSAECGSHPKSPPPKRRSRSPYRPRRARSRSPRRKRRSRSRSLSSNKSISSPSSRSSSPSHRRRSPRRRRSRSRSSEMSRSRRSFSPKRHSTSISPSRRRPRR